MSGEIDSIHNTGLCSHTGSTTYTGTNFHSLYDRLENCGNDRIWLMSTVNGDEIAPRRTCDLKVCSNDFCMKHRGKVFYKRHSGKIDDIQRSMVNPLSFVFTDGLVDFDVDREYLSSRMNLLYALLSDVEFGSKSGFSIHMELKPQDDGFYLHFHVLTDGIKDLKVVQNCWSRVVRYEYAVSPGHVVKYVCKYASKTPVFDSDVDLEFYYMATFKFRMHRFSSSVCNDSVESEWVMESRLWSEIRYCMNNERFGRFFAYYNLGDYEGKKKNVLEFPEYEDPPFEVFV